MKNWKWWMYIRYFYNCYLIEYSSPQKHYWFISVARDGMADQVKFFFAEIILYQARTLISFFQGRRTVLVGTLYLGAKTLIMGWFFFSPVTVPFSAIVPSMEPCICVHRLAELESVQHVIFIDIFVPYQCAQRGSWKIAFLFLLLLSTFRSGDFT